MSALLEILEAIATELATKNQKTQNKAIKRDFKADFQKLLKEQSLQNKASLPSKDDFINVESKIDESKGFMEGKKSLIQQSDAKKDRFFDDFKVDMRRESAFSSEQNFEVHDFSKGDDLGVGLTLQEQEAEKSTFKQHPLLEKLKNPTYIRDAIIISEILKRR